MEERVGRGPAGPLVGGWTRLGHGREAVVVALAVALFYVALRTSPYLAAGAFHDDGVYLAVGKALADGEGYRSLYAVGEPVHAKYPPGLPVVYALLWSLSSELGFVHAAALVLSLLFTAATAGVLWWLARARMGLGAPFALFFVTGPFLLEGSVQYFNLPASEPYFMLCWAGVLVLYSRMGRSPSFGSAALLGALVATAVLFRTMGVVLVPAVVLAMVLRRMPWRSIATVTATSMLPVAVWKAWHLAALRRGPVGAQPDEGAYVAWMPEGDVAERLRFLVDLVESQFTFYGAYMPPHLSGLWALGMALWLVLVALTVRGGWLRWREDPDLVLSCAGSAAIVFLWPWWQDRFVLTMLPFFGLLAATAVQAWTRTGTARVRRSAIGALAVLTVLVAVRQAEIRGLAFPEEGGGEPLFHPAQFLPHNTLYLLAATSWLDTEAPERGSILAPMPVGIWLYRGWKVVNATPALPDVGPSVWDEPGRFLSRRLAEDRPDLVALWQLNERIALEVSVAQEACPDGLEYLGFSPRYTRVAFYRVNYDDACLRERFVEPGAADLAAEAAARR